ncbi:MAG: murein hydrolase activator EnvC family protein [Crocinitomicaceae bacterium]
MSNVSKVIILVIFSCFVILKSFGQTSAKLRKEQDRLEAKLANSKSLLNKTRNNTETSLGELRLIESQIRLREQLVLNFDSQIKSADKRVQAKEEEIDSLKLKLEILKEQYRKMLIYAYKHRNKYSELMQIISAEDYHEAQKRKKYIEKLGALQQQQLFIIKQNEKLLEEEIASIKEEKERKLAILLEKKKEAELILHNKEEKEQIYQKFKTKEGELVEQIRSDELKREVLKEKINLAIRKEIEIANKKAAEEAERKRKEAEEAIKREQEALANKKKSVEKSKEVTINFVKTKDVSELDKNFELNKGKLPWPVEKGTITEGFGKNAHPTLENVFTNNSGIDITAPKSAQVRAVFEGEVTSILNIPGAGKVVIIKHGNYRTVYTNLQNTYVIAGTIVKTKQAIGSLIVQPNSQISVAHFEIHQVVGSAVKCLNPSLWIFN